MISSYTHRWGSYLAAHDLSVRGAKAARANIIQQDFEEGFGREGCRNLCDRVQCFFCFDT